MDCQKSLAGIKLWMLRTKINDLLCQDMGRFVDGKGSGCGSEKQWRDDISELLGFAPIKEHFPASYNECAKLAGDLGILNSLEEAIARGGNPPPPPRIQANGRKL